MYAAVPLFHAISTGISLDDRVAEAIRNQLLQRAGAEVKAKVEETPVEEPVKKEPIKVGEGQKLASDLLGITVVDDFAVSMLDVASIPPQVSALIPRLDVDYKVQPEEALTLLRAWEEGDKTLIVGPTGSGKSSLVAYCCALTNRPMIRLNMTGDTESSVIFGSLVVRGGATEWVDGPATEAVKYGAVLAVDEWEVTPPEIMFGFQFLLEDGGKLFLKEKPGTSHDKLIVPHDNHRLVFIGNTLGQGDDTGSYAGTNVQNTATLDRFQTTIVLGYLDTKHEQGILSKKFPKIKAAILNNMVKVAGLIRTANQQGNIALTMSPRTLINWGRKINTYGDVKVAFTIAFLNKLKDSDRKVVTELYNKVFGR